MKFFADLQNSGEDCWHHCNSEQGLCDWCGARQGWTGNGCDGSFGGANGHECVLKPGKMWWVFHLLTIVLYRGGYFAISPNKHWGKVSSFGPEGKSFWVFIVCKYSQFWIKNPKNLLARHLANFELGKSFPHGIGVCDKIFTPALLPDAPINSPFRRQWALSYQKTDTFLIW